MVFSTPPEPQPRGALESLGVDVRVLDFRSPRAGLVLLLWFREYRPDIVHFHFLEPRARFVAAAKLCGATTLVQDRALPASPAVTQALGHRARELALHWLVDTRLEVHDAVPLARFDGRDGASVRRELGIGERPLVVSPALDEMKGGDTLLRALALLESDVHLAIAGEDPSEKALRVLASRSGLASRVHFLGARDDLEDILAAASVVVVAPESEDAFAIAAIEGMAASRPVIVTRSGALPAILGDAGLVVPQRDPASLGLAIRTVLSDPEQGARLGKLGRKRVEEHYSSDAYLEQLMKRYRRIFLRSEPRTAPARMLELA
jgi:glycosyltransferase involved in cell wall biosynthesis